MAVSVVRNSGGAEPGSVGLGLPRCCAKIVAGAKDHLKAPSVTCQVVRMRALKVWAWNRRVPWMSLCLRSLFLWLSPYASFRIGRLLEC